MNPSELARIAGAMVAKGKGILAADESTGTIKKRFDSIRLDSTEEHRRTYRELLFTAPAAAESVSAVIFYDETLRQKTKDGTPFPQYLTRQGIVPGIKVDTGAKPLAGFPGETITEGLDGLRERLIEYHGLGARFAKWRAVIDIGAGIPTSFAIEANAHGQTGPFLTRQIAIVQKPRMDLPAFQDLDPSLPDPDFNFQPIHRVRMDGLVAAIGLAGQDGFDDRGDHL